MITRDNYTEEHIRFLQSKSKGDPGLIERTLFAFGLLEALSVSGLDFTFKGGTRHIVKCVQRKEKAPLTVPFMKNI